MHYRSLDSVRGIAALSVVLHHCVLARLITIPAGLWTAASRYTPLHFFINGRAPVILFFVLSGFVLSLSMERTSIRPEAFASRRICRLLGPFLAAILLSALLGSVQGGTAFPSGSWIGKTWSTPPDAALVLAQWSAPVLGVDLTLDRAAWSLVHEVRISVVFPLLWLACMASPLLALAGSGALFLAGRSWSGCADAGCLPFNGEATAASFGATAYFVLFFVVGILLARSRDGLVRWMQEIAPMGRLGLWIVAVYGMIIPFKFEWMPDLPVGISAGLVLLLTLATPSPASLLAKPPLRWLGRISFSLYLVHIPVIAAAIRWGEMGPARLVLALMGSLVAAEIFFRAVERPSMTLGRHAAVWTEWGTASAKAVLATSR